MYRNNLFTERKRWKRLKRSDNEVLLELFKRSGQITNLIEYLNATNDCSLHNDISRADKGYTHLILYMNRQQDTPMNNPDKYLIGT